MEFAFDTQVDKIEKAENGYKITAGSKVYETRCLVNAAGVYADVFNNMVSSRKLSITPRKGEYILMDKRAGDFVSHTIFQLPTAMGKGVLITPTVHGNLLAGPTAEDVPEKDKINTTAAGLSKLSAQAELSAEQVPLRMAITSFAGLRATEKGGDFVLGEAEDAEGFFNAAGIESPGLSSAPAIGVYLAEQVAEKMKAEKKTAGITGRNQSADRRRSGIWKCNLQMRNRYRGRDSKCHPKTSRRKISGRNQEKDKSRDGQMSVRFLCSQSGGNTGKRTEHIAS